MTEKQQFFPCLGGILQAGKKVENAKGRNMFRADAPTLKAKRKTHG